MGETVKALLKVNEGYSGVALQELDEPIIESSEQIKIKVHAAGICGTDMHIIYDEYPVNMPVVMGHEFSGTIVEVGSDVKDFAVGDRVVSLTAAVTCGKCIYCKQGVLMLCNARKSIGSGVNGAFAEYLIVPSRAVYKIPENISLDEAALSEPLACVVRCLIERGTVTSNHHVVISGVGAIGMLALQVSVANGAKVVVVGTSRDEERLKIAKEFGAYEAINIEEPDAFERLQKLGGTYGFDVAIECAGHESSLDNCIQLLRKQGELIQVGLYGKSIRFNSDLLLMKEIKYVNGFASNPTSWDIALTLMKENKVSLSKLISHKYALDDWEAAINSVKQGQGFKTLFMPNA